MNLVKKMPKGQAQLKVSFVGKEVCSFTRGSRGRGKGEFQQSNGRIAMKEFRYKEIMLHFDYPNSENLAPGVCVWGGASHCV